MKSAVSSSGCIVRCARLREGAGAEARTIRARNLVEPEPMGQSAVSTAVDVHSTIQPALLLLELVDVPRANNRRSNLAAE